MTRLRNALLLVVLSIVAVGERVAAQQPGASASLAQARTAAIVASFNKSKHVVKQKHGIRVAKYKEIRSEPAAPSDPRTYSGTYEVPDLQLTLNLQFDQKGRGEGTGDDLVGTDAAVKRRFRLVGAKMEGALLTGTKVYADGSSDRFEGVFLNRTSFDDPADKGVTRFGLGVIGKATSIRGNTVDKLFYELRR
jgi:hypothetical protein